jgi:hypothetical protein
MLGLSLPQTAHGSDQSAQEWCDRSNEKDGTNTPRSKFLMAKQEGLMRGLVHLRDGAGLLVTSPVLTRGDQYLAQVVHLQEERQNSLSGMFVRSYNFALWTCNATVNLSLQRMPGLVYAT